MVGVELDSQAKNPLGFTVHTSAGEKLQIVAKNGVQKQVRLSRVFPWRFLACFLLVSAHFCRVLNSGGWMHCSRR